MPADPNPRGTKAIEDLTRAVKDNTKAVEANTKLLQEIHKPRIPYGQNPYLERSNEERQGQPSVRFEGDSSTAGSVTGVGDGSEAGSSGR